MALEANGNFENENSLSYEIGKEVVALQDLYVEFVGKSIYDPREVHALTEAIAKVFFRLENVFVQKPLVVEQFWEFWTKPDVFIEKYPELVNFVVKYSAGKKYHFESFEDIESAKKRAEELSEMGYAVSIIMLPKPSFLEEVMRAIVSAAVEANILPLRPRVSNSPKPPLKNVKSIFSRVEAAMSRGRG